MARKFTGPIDLQTFQILNFLHQALSSDLTANSGNAGQAWFNTTTNLLKWSNGSVVIDPLARANHSGTQLAATISNLAATVQAYTLNSFAAPIASVPMGSQQFSSLAAAASPGQAVEYSQFNTALAGIQSGLDFKQHVNIVALVNVTVTAPGATINGLTMVAGMRVLLTAQTTTSQNGLWTWNGAAVAMTRPSDSPSGTSGDIVPGTVVEGYNATNRVLYFQTGIGTGTNGAIIVDTDAQTWINPYNAVNYAGSTSISIIAGVIAAIVTTGLTITGAGIGVDTSVVARKFAGTLPIGTTTTTITHNLNNSTPVAVFRQAGAEVGVDNTATDANNLSVTFGAATTVATTYSILG